MDLRPAPAIRAAMIDLIDRGDLGYYYAAIDALAPTWCEWVRARDGVVFEPAEVRPFTGVMHALELAMVWRTEPGDGVALLSPIYHPFRDSIEDSGRRVVDVPLGAADRLDVERLEASLDGRTKVLLMSQPHNPLGRVFSVDEIRALADVAERHDLLIVSDEIWADLVHEPRRHVSLVAADERLRERTVTLGSASKAFNISGLRCAVGHVGPPELRRMLDGLSGHLPGGPSTIAAVATLTAWTECPDWLAETRAHLTANRDRVATRLAAELPEVGFAPPEATYLAWLDMTRTGLGDDPAAVILERAGVALSEGWRFGHQGVGHARLNFATTTEILDEILDRIVAAVREGASP